VSEELLNLLREELERSPIETLRAVFITCKKKMALLEGYYYSRCGLEQAIRKLPPRELESY
jgi:hypothetical protein